MHSISLRFAFNLLYIIQRFVQTIDLLITFIMPIYCAYRLIEGCL